MPRAIKAIDESIKTPMKILMRKKRKVLPGFIFSLSINYYKSTYRFLSHTDKNKAKKSKLF